MHWRIKHGFSDCHSAPPCLFPFPLVSVVVSTVAFMLVLVVPHFAALMMPLTIPVVLMLLVVATQAAIDSKM